MPRVPARKMRALPRAMQSLPQDPYKVQANGGGVAAAFQTPIVATATVSYSLRSATINNGIYEGRRILQNGTVREMLREQIAKSKLADWMEIQGLAWYARRLRGGDLVWGHGGADPGISTLMLLRPSDQVGIILFANTGGVGGELQDIAERFLQETQTLNRASPAP